MDQQSEKSFSNNSEADWRFITDSELRRNQIPGSELNPDFCKYDAIKLGYWVFVPSPTATKLALLGCTLRSPMYNHYNKPPRIPKR